jgi:glyoxylase-like metal-dependent hydrolase (beta-lactamase superfamily II)
MGGDGVNSGISAPPGTALAQPVGNGVYLIDTLYVRPGLAASHLVVDDGRAAFVDTGAAPAAPRLLAALDEIGIAREQVDYLFLTHVHLDHAGGAGQLVQALPNARAVLHPRGAPHMIDPSKLIAGSIQVYGEALYRELYGELLPIPAERVLVAGDGLRLRLGRRTFEFFDAPGHARHHHCPVDLDHREVYSGDNFGICYREFDTARGPFMLPTTTPVQFEPDALHATIDRLMSYRPQRIYQTHFGPVTDVERLARDLHESLVEFVRIARHHARDPDRRARIEEELFRWLSEQLDGHGYDGDPARRHAFLDEDVRLNAAGLEVWLDRV